MREVRIKKDYFCLNTASPLPLRRTEEGANRQRGEPQVPVPCEATLVVLERANRTTRQEIHRVDQPGKSGWIFGSAQTGHVG